jgi:6-phosphogluconolactonase
VSPRLHVGTYARNGGAGLHPLRYSSKDGWSVGDPCAEVQNASFGTYSARHKLHYFVDEQAEGALGAFRENSDGWQQLARVPTHGAEPCYVSLNADESCLAVANYGSGSIALFQLDDRTGLPLDPPTIRQHAGSGPVQDRQDGPHAHCACFSRDQRWLYHADLGTDQIIAYPADRAARSIGEHRIAYSAPAGSGPRHLAFHPILPFALLASELASTLTVLQIANGSLAAWQKASTLPRNFAGESLAGHLSLNSAGDRVYVTNRGHDSIAVFAWDEGGSLELLQHMPSGGASPRSFVLLEAKRQLVLANEEEGNIVAFPVQADGTLSPHDGDITVPGAVFLIVGQR